MLLPLIAGPLVSGSAIAGLVDGRSRPVGWVAGVLLGLGWAAGVVAVLVPHPLGLTALRVLGPAALGVAVLAVPFGDAGAAAEVAALAWGVICVSAVVAGSTIDAFVDGSSYGAERRWALRIPANLLLGPLPMAWLVIVGAAAGGPLLLASGQWLAGALVVVLGGPLAFVGLRALHGLAQRIVVFVPAGFVLVDRAVLAQPVLFPRVAVSSLAPAERGTAATDLTAGASGLVVEVELAEPVAIARRRGRRDFRDEVLNAFLVSPVRPGAVLRSAAAHHLPVT